MKIMNCMTERENEKAVINYCRKKLLKQLYGQRDAAIENNQYKSFVIIDNKIDTLNREAVKTANSCSDIEGIISHAVHFYDNPYNTLYNKITISYVHEILNLLLKNVKEMLEREE